MADFLVDDGLGHLRGKPIEHKEYIRRHGDDMPEIAGWSWGRSAATRNVRSTEADNV